MATVVPVALEIVSSGKGDGGNCAATAKHGKSQSTAFVIARLIRQPADPTSERFETIMHKGIEIRLPRSSICNPKLPTGPLDEKRDFRGFISAKSASSGDRHTVT
jgi:hypothetical protein